MLPEIVVGLGLPLIFKAPGWAARLLYTAKAKRASAKAADERRLNEATILKNEELRHRGCVRPGEEIDEGRSKNFIPLGPCGLCGVHLRNPRRL